MLTIFCIDDTGQLRPRGHVCVDEFLYFERRQTLSDSHTLEHKWHLCKCRFDDKMMGMLCVVFYILHAHQSSPDPGYPQCCRPARVHTATEFSMCPSHHWHKRERLWPLTLEKVLLMYTWIHLGCVSMHATLRFGFMCGLDEPPGGGEQQSHRQLSHWVCQNIRGVTHTDPSGERAKHTNDTQCYTHMSQGVGRHKF